MEGKNDTGLKYKIVRFLGLKILDIYVIRKFLGTFFLSIALILAIVVIFDLSEKIDDFLESGAKLKVILFDYYLNFIPYFAVLFSSLFAFIAVIYFTSRMAYNTEIIAILTWLYALVPLMAFTRPGVRMDGSLQPRGCFLGEV